LLLGEAKMSFRDLFDDILSGDLNAPSRPANYFIGEGYGRDIKEAYISFLSCDMPYEELEGVYPTQAIPLDPPDPEDNIKQWRLEKLELAQGRSSIAFGYVDMCNKGRKNSTLPPGVKRYAFFGLTASRDDLERA
jgi:hypothetical protein